MFAVLEAMRKEDLSPAIAWARGHRAEAEAKMGALPASPMDTSDDPDSQAAAARRAYSEMGLAAEQAAAAATALEFRLHAVEFLTRLEKQGKAAALDYAKHNLSPLVVMASEKVAHCPDRVRSGGCDMAVLQRLMGCLMFQSG